MILNLIFNYKNDGVNSQFSCNEKIGILFFCRTLSILKENFAPFSASSSKPHKLSSTNILNLAEGCCQISELLKVQLLSGMDKISLRKEIDVTGLEMKTVAEKNAEQVNYLFVYY